MKRFIFILSFFSFLLGLSADIKAQTLDPINVAIYDQELFATAITDTLVNTDAATFLWRNYSNYPHQYNWLIVNDEISGTGTVTVKVQEAPMLDPGTSGTSADWYTTNTYTITTDTTILLNRDLTYGRRVRLYVSSSGTGRNVLTPVFTIKRQETSYGN